MSHEEYLTIADTPVGMPQNIRSVGTLLNSFGQSGSLHLICDENTHVYCYPLLSDYTSFLNEPIVIPAGEDHKNLKTCQFVWKSLIRQGANRSSTVVNLGGGVVTDLGGFCAATYMRGIPFVHIPTSLLAMCDAALGGKHGVDFEGLKNYIGLIHQPSLILIYTPFLLTLPERQLRSGMAEIVKHAIIGDVGLFASLGFEELPLLAAKQFLTPAIKVKKELVEKDVHDRGVRAALNFGHTFGHALESYFLETNTPLLHGECVALGMAVETWISHFHFGSPDRETCRRIIALIRKYTPVLVPHKVRLQALMPFLDKDKKSREGVVRYALIRELGKPAVDQNIDPSIMDKLLDDDEVAILLPWLLR